MARIRAGEEIAAHHGSRPSSFIGCEETADFLVWTADREFTGPVNACSHGEPEVTELCELIARQEGRTPGYRRGGDGELSPFSFGH
ncbi:hypothetical protein [Kitasatospora sp. GP82]|uniref:hypothetical protein n=1 Tax=Kitasatospora sp. GP82 TaxID=3035089 RepID=UPI00247C7CBD|nr:hypothetical protein [Kitasatospora sp. GP82]